MDGLYVGSAPPPGTYSDRFDVIVLTAEEYQPMRSMFPDVRVRRFPFDDAQRPALHDLAMAWTAAQSVAGDLIRQRRVLVTCAMGRNRSALVAALAVHLVTGDSGADALRLVREKRVDDVGVRALSNQSFQRFLRSIPAG